MNAHNKTFPRFGRILYGIGGLSVLTECVLALLFVRWFPIFGVDNVSLMVAAAVGIGLPIVVMPIFYTLINGNTAIATGKYHLPMVISALVASLSLVFMLGVGRGNRVGQAFALLGLMFVYSLGIQIYRFSCYAVELRYDPMGSAGRLGGVFSAVAVVVGAVLLMIENDTADYIRTAVSLSGIVLLLSALCVYMTTVRFMPSFVRLEPYHHRPISAIYHRFFAPLRHGTTKLIISGAFISLTGVTLVAAAVPTFVFAFILGNGPWYYCAVSLSALVTVAVAAVSFLTVSKKSAVLPSAVPIACGAAELSAAVWVIVMVCVSPSGITAKLAATAFSVISGLTVGMFFAFGRLNEKHAVKCSQATQGRYRCLYNAFAFTAFAAGLAVTAAIMMISAGSGLTAAILTAALCGVFLPIGAVLHNMGLKFGRNEKENG